MTESSKIKEEINLKNRSSIDFDNAVGNAAKLQLSGKISNLGNK